MKNTALQISTRVHFVRLKYVQSTVCGRYLFGGTQPIELYLSAQCTLFVRCTVRWPCHTSPYRSSVQETNYILVNPLLFVSVRLIFVLCSFCVRFMYGYHTANTLLVRWCSVMYVKSVGKFCACTKLETYCRRTKQTSPNTKRICRIIAGHMKNIKRTLTNTNGFAKIPSVSYTEDRSGVVWH